MNQSPARIALGLLAGTVVSIVSPAMANDEIRVETALTGSVTGTNAPRGEADYRVSPDRIDFKIEIEKLPVGSYEFLVNGAFQNTIVVVPTATGNEGELEYSDPVRAGKLPLVFNPDGARFEIASNGAVILSGTATPIGGSPGGGGGAGGGGSSGDDNSGGGSGDDNPSGDDNSGGGSSGDDNSGGGSGGGTPVGDIPSGGPRLEIETFLFPTENGINGSKGETDFRTRPDRVDFKVEIEDVPLGAYEFFVNGAFHGTIQVISTASGPEGELEYANPPRAGKLPLTFNPDGALFEVKRDGVVILAALAPFSDQPGAANGGAVTFPKQKLKGSMDVLDDSRARGVVRAISSRNKAKLIAQFVRLDPGRYTFCSNGNAIAEFEFVSGKQRIIMSSIPGANEMLLNFDPTNSSYELMRDGVMVMSGSLDGTALGNGVLPLGEIERSFSNSGVDIDAAGRARLRTRADRTDFNVEVEDLDVGEYRLVVDGLEAGTIRVVATEDGTEGEIEFQNPTDDPDKILLTFDPRGRTIQVMDGSIVVLSLVF